MRTPESHRHSAAVFRSEADARRLKDPVFAGLLDQWADNADRRADRATVGMQRDLFAA